MWQLIRSELRYNWLKFGLFLAAVPLLFLIELRYREVGASFFAFILLMMMVNTWYALQIREKRDFQHIQLPLSTRRIALARILMVILLSAGFVCFFVALRLALRPEVPLNPRLVLSAAGGVILVFSLAFMFRDRFLGSKNLMRGKLLLVALLGATLVANVLTFTAGDRAREQGAEPPAIIRVFDFFERHNPTTTNLATAIFLAVSLALAALTVETFARRRSQI